MSYVIEIIRTISKEEILALARVDEELTVLASGDDWIDWPILVLAWQWWFGGNGEHS
jgi:hypothetical protein